MPEKTIGKPEALSCPKHRSYKSYTEDDLIPLSALQHYVFCPRQCALIHIEQQWSENRFTAEGRAQHDRVDRPEHEMRDGVRYEFGMAVRSLKLGLIGKTDVVEFQADGTVFPVEHKRGRPKPDHCDWIQLCAQALCLEEMLKTFIPSGAIFYGQPRRRQEVNFTEELRTETLNAICQVHGLIQSAKTPPPEYNEKKCSSCSLFDLCLPNKFRSVAAYLRENLP